MAEFLPEKLVREWSWRVDTGMPDYRNPLHLVELKNLLIERRFPHQFIDGLLNNLNEQKFYARNPKGKQISVFTNKDNYEKAVKGGYEPVDREDAEKELGKQDEKPESPDVDDSKEKSKPPSKPKIVEPEDNPYDKKDGKDDKTSIVYSLNNGNLDGIIKTQNDLQEKRDKGIAGAGGPIASQGESLYVKNINNRIDIGKYSEKHREQIDVYKEKIIGRGLKASEKRTIQALGLSEEGGVSYLAMREHHAQEELRRIKDIEDSVFYKKGKKGFNGKDEPYLEWCYAAFDGALETNRILKSDTNLDTSQEYTTVQSESQIDNEVESHLEEQVKNTEGEDKEYYEKELASFKKFREYHDTFVIGKDKNGRTHIVSVSNKKGDDLKDPHNNTTPAKRLSVIKERFGEDVAKTVSKTIADGIEKVSDTKQNAVKRSSELQIDGEVTKVCETEEMAPYVDKLNNHTGFREYLETNNHNYDELSTNKKLKLMQDYSKMLLQNEQKPAYEPFGKIATKIGEFVRTKKFRSQYPNINYDSLSINECMDIKQDEKEAVSKTHKTVVQEIGNADKEMGYPKEGKNGPHTQGYIDSVLDVLHYNTYIDGGDGKIIAQMGINGAQPKHIRGCLKDLSGFKGETDTPQGREELKNYLRGECTIDSDSGAVYVESSDGRIQLAEDTWRTAGTSQKVASGFGSDVRKCITDKLADERRG